MLKGVLGVLEDDTSITASIPSIARCYAGLWKLADAIDEAAVIAHKAAINRFL